MLSLHIRNPYSLHGQIDVENADNPGGHVIGQLYEIKKGTAGSAFSCLRYQGINHKVGDTLIVLDVRVNEDHPTKMPWKDVHVLINGKLARFKSWAFSDLIDTQSIKLVK